MFEYFLVEGPVIFMGGGLQVSVYLGRLGRAL